MANDTNDTKIVELKLLIDGSRFEDTLHATSKTKMNCTETICKGSILNTMKSNKYDLKNEDLKDKELKEQAIDFIEQFYKVESIKKTGVDKQERIRKITDSINEKHTYNLEKEELEFGAKTAWRNASRCIGRNNWENLQLFDCRKIETTREMCEAIFEHIKYSYKNYKINPAITVFRQRTTPEIDFRIWNSLIFAYAGYKDDETGTILGDKAQVDFTKICIKLGWNPPEPKSEFDMLPLVLQANGQTPEIFDLPDELKHEVHITHPNHKYRHFNELKLKWYAIPAIASMKLEVGGIEFTACPSNGWFMSTEIARDLIEENRFNKLEAIADKLGLNSEIDPLWKDRTLLELNCAILHSFKQNKTTIIDHHTASELFIAHHEKENELRGGCPADWVWIVPPMSGHLTRVWHLEMLNYCLKPSFEYQINAWKEPSNREFMLRKGLDEFVDPSFKPICPNTPIIPLKTFKCTILYASETGKSERFAKKVFQLFKPVFEEKSYLKNLKLVRLDEYNIDELDNEKIILIITSTFGNGDAPFNGKLFKKKIINRLNENPKRPLNPDIKFSVFALGNRDYPNFCEFGKLLFRTFNELNASSIKGLSDVVEGDETKDQESSFKMWCQIIYESVLKEEFEIPPNSVKNEQYRRLTSIDVSWNLDSVKIFDGCKESLSKIDNLRLLHNQPDIFSFHVEKEPINFARSSDRTTLLVELKVEENLDELNYCPGDHIGIFGENNDILVNKVLKRLVDAPNFDQPISINCQGVKTSNEIPKYTLREAFKCYLDITTPLTQRMLSYLSETLTLDDLKDTEKLNEKVKLENYARNSESYNKWKINYPNLAEALDEFPSVKPSYKILLTKLPKLRPRFYSVSSSQKISNDIVAITFGVVRYQPDGKPVHYGVCSKWLSCLNQINQTSVPAFIRKAPSFHMPSDVSLPIIMVSAGTGIAPFRSFWQERLIQKKKGKKVGEMYLYFGCRLPNVDELHKNEIEEMENKGIITECFKIFSQKDAKIDPNKRYVQHLIRDKMDKISEILFKNGGHFYVCGDVNMANEVDELMRKNFEKKDEEEEDRYQKLKDEDRYHEDVFGERSKFVKETSSPAVFVSSPFRSYVEQSGS